MQNFHEDKKINMFDRTEVRKLCGEFKCTPYDLYVAYRKMGDSYKSVRNYIEKVYSKNYVQFTMAHSKK